MAKKELSWQFIHETGGQKYFLVQSSRDEYFVFRTPPAASTESKSHYTLANWEGEVVPWGGVPVKVRSWLGHKKVRLASPKSTTIIIQT
jgi:hypothetical protein